MVRLRAHSVLYLGVHSVLRGEHDHGVPCLLEAVKHAAAVPAGHSTGTGRGQNTTRACQCKHPEKALVHQEQQSACMHMSLVYPRLTHGPLPAWRGRLQAAAGGPQLGQGTRDERDVTNKQSYSTVLSKVYRRLTRSPLPA